MSATDTVTSTAVATTSTSAGGCEGSGSDSGAAMAGAGGAEITMVSGPAGCTPAASSAPLIRARSSRATSSCRIGAVLATRRMVTSLPDSPWAPHTSGFSSISSFQPPSL